MRRQFLLLIIATLIASAIFCLLGQEIETFNAKFRNLVWRGKFAKMEFSPSGIPSQAVASMGEYTSPFYVVHYGLMYSDACNEATEHSGFHWLPDPTQRFWPDAPDHITMEYFHNSLEWLLENVSYEINGQAHFLYDFNWPYKGYPGGKLIPPWWSGLTDAHAITLLLRGYDCFSDQRYLSLAADLYKSSVTPIDQGGSLTSWDGHPWIEEYVDPRVPSSDLSRVWNGMAYSYFGIKAYEEFIGQERISSELFDSMAEHVEKYDLGVWSYYDAIGSRANIKYHLINWALIKDDRLGGIGDWGLRFRWGVGSALTVIYLFMGPQSFSLMQAWLTLLLMIVAIYLFLYRVLFLRRDRS